MTIPEEIPEPIVQSAGKSAGSRKVAQNHALVTQKDQSSSRAHAEVPKARKKSDTKQLSDYTDSHFIDIPDKRSRESGAKTHHLLLQLTRLCTIANTIDGGDGGQRVRCIASAKCSGVWKGKRAKARILKHAKNCGYLPTELCTAAMQLLASKAAIDPANDDDDSDMNSHERGSDDENDSDATLDPHSKTASNKRHFAVTGTARNPIFKSFMMQGQQNLKAKADKVLMLLLVCNGLPPTVIDSAEFKRYSEILNSQYIPPSSTTMNDSLIPVEAARTELEVVRFLKKQRNLTISFDGGKIRKPVALYTVHITTADRRTFLMDIDNASKLSHTGNYVFETANRVCAATLML